MLLDNPSMHFIDWVVVAVLCLVSLGVGLFYSRESGKEGAGGYFTGNRNVPWWAIGLSNTATYSSGQGAFVMLVLVFGLAGNWLWWAAWVVWMPLVAIIWAPLWRRMGIVTTAELITLRYGGGLARVARKLYAAVCCFGFCVLIIAYVTGFFAKTLAPLVPMSETQILLIFGGITVAYTMFGGLVGVVYTDVIQFFVMLAGGLAFMFFAVPEHGGWGQLLSTVSTHRPEALRALPPAPGVGWATVGILVLQGLFFAGSPTAGEGMTAQRFMSARSERHAIGGQLFNAFLALSLRTIPLIGLGVVALALFWTADLAKDGRAAPAGFDTLKDPAYAWGELIVRSKLPVGLVGLLVAAEVAAYMSTLSSLINWGSSFVVNDLLEAREGQTSVRRQIWVSRAVTLVLFVISAAVAMLWVKGMVDWFLFINSAMVIFLLPLAWLRFFWWRFNVWGELAAIGLGLPVAIVVWFTLGFKDRPMWQGVGLLFALSFVVLLAVTLLTRPESQETLARFYARCRPPGRWGPVREQMGEEGAEIGPSVGRQVADSAIGTMACLGLVVATNAVFVKDWAMTAGGVAATVGFGAWLLARMLGGRRVTPAEHPAVSSRP